MSWHSVTETSVYSLVRPPGACLGYDVLPGLRRREQHFLSLISSPETPAVVIPLKRHIVRALVASRHALVSLFL